jgi:hypothetical protein
MRTLAFGLGVCLLLGPAGRGAQETPPRAARYVMPSAQGTGDGTSWTNAAPISRLDTLIAAVGPGGVVYVRADAGPYAFKGDPVSIAHGGTEGMPVTVIGVDASLAPAKAVMIGDRTAWTLPNDPEKVTNVGEWREGPVIFRLSKGADHLTLKFLDFQRTGHPFYLTGPTHTGITVEDCSAYNFRRFFEHDLKTSHVGTVIRRVTGTGFSKTAIRIRGDSHDVVLQDIVLDSGRQDGDTWATGVELNDTAHDVTMTRVTVKNCHDTSWNRPDVFWNADGFSSEPGNYNITRIECVSTGHTDAGFDDKGRNVKHVNCTASGNSVNYKFWGPSHVNENCKALNPRRRGNANPQYQYWLAGSGEGVKQAGDEGDLVILGGEISDDDPRTSVFALEGSNAQLRVIGVSVKKHPGAAIQDLGLSRTGNVILYGSPADRKPPAVTSTAAITARANMPQAHVLRADEPVTWSIVGGDDAAHFSLVPNRKALTLKVKPFASGSKKVVVRARDASNDIAEQLFTVTIGEAATPFFQDDFNRSDRNLAEHGDWTFLDGYGEPQDVAIRAQKLSIFNAESNGILYGSPDVGFADHYVQARVASVPQEPAGALCTRAADSWNLIAVQFSMSGIHLLARSNGDFKELTKAPGAPAVGDVLRLEVKGTNATVKKNGVVILGPVPTGGVGDGATRQGILSSNAAVDPWIDDYESGPL